MEFAPAPATTERVVVFDESMLRSPELVKDFYMRRGARRVWVYEDKIQGRGLELLNVLATASSEGLGDEDYHLPLLKSLLYRSDITSAELRAFEMLATDAVLSYGHHLAGRRVAPDSVYRIYQPPRKTIDPVACIDEALARGADLATVLDCLRPDHEVYQGLREALARMRSIVADGGWSSLPDSLVLRPGDVAASVPMLRRRMLAGGDLDTVLVGDHYDACLERAVMRFQRRHGLPEDGVVGPATIAALNVPASVRADQITLNLERARWLPRGLGDRRLQVNIPDFRLEVFEAGEPVLSLRAVVGTLSRPTPVLNGRITSMVINPYWNIPNKLAREDVLPRVRRDSTYLSRRNIRIYKGWGPDAEELAPSTIDWKGMVSERLPFVMRQDPGPLNPLGRVKFMFWNDYSVFIHDTTAKSKFSASRRAYSSGCVRVENPLELASYMMGWSEGEDAQAAAGVEADSEDSNMKTLLATEQEQVLRVPRPMPVLLMYQTAWMDEGELHFRDDLYGYDRTLRVALANRQGLPGTDGTGIDVDEPGAGIPADTASLQGARGATELTQLDTGHP